jgi:hypothetical protein
MKLSWIINVGRYRNDETGQEYNVKKGKNKLRGTDHYFYLYRNKKIKSLNDIYFKTFANIKNISYICNITLKNY